MLGRILLAASAVILAAGFAQAQEIVGFAREDFGKVVLSQKQYGAELEASVGNYNNEPISRYGSNSLFAKLGRPVGRLDILTDAGTFPCTGFLISEQYVLTNYHCVPGIVEDRRVNATRVEAVQFVLGYTREGIEDGVEQFTVSPAPVETDKTLDYAVLEVFGAPSEAFGTVKLASAMPSDRSPYWIIGHPLGEAQRISREDCLSDAPAVASGRLRHRCDTLPGNSGSPVIDPGLRAAVALHHAGSRRNAINYAIPLARIAKASELIAGVIEEGGVEVPAQTAATPSGSESAREVWQAIETTESADVLKKFIARYPNSFFTELAKARLKELKEQKVAIGVYPDEDTDTAPACDGVEVALASGGSKCIEPGSGESFKDCADCPEMVVVPAGSFMMGSSEKEIAAVVRDFPGTKKEWVAGEGPRRRVSIAKPFAVGKFEVTRGQFERFVKATGHNVGKGCWTYDGEWKEREGKSYRDPGYSQTADHPVACVNWPDAKAYVKWLSRETGQPYRLLSEAEWEYMARAGAQTRFSFGDKTDDLCGHANGADRSTSFVGRNKACDDGVGERTAEVGRYRANAWGLHDVSGNVWEWVEDCYVDSYTGAPDDGSARTDGACSSRVLRGGSWSNDPQLLRSANRSRYWPGLRFNSYGFRVARTLNP